jgi:predicted DNA-binding transcriptional regulator AlpA
MNPANDNSPHWPRGLRRTMAAAYIGVSLSRWDNLVADGRMPKPKRFIGMTIWDRLAVDQAFDLLDGGNARDLAGREELEFAA